MARKRLSDLLREEEQKTSAAGVPQESSPPEQNGQSEPTRQPEAEPVPVTAEVVVDAAQPTEESKLRRADQPDQADQPESNEPDLAVTVAQLKAELAAMQQLQNREVELEAQITSLQTQLTAQEATIQQLQSQVETQQQTEAQQVQQTEQLKAELDSAKQMILQLSQANAKPAAPASQPPASSPPAASKPPAAVSRTPVAPAPQPLQRNLSYLPSPRAAEPELESNNTQIIVPSAKPSSPDRPKLHQLELRKVLDHPTRPGSLPPMSSEPKPAEKEDVKLSETDVGWMD